MAQCASGLSLCSDGYLHNQMTMTNVVLGVVFGAQFTDSIKTALSASYLAGATAGQLVIGQLCDRIGRRNTAWITFVCIALGCSLSMACFAASEDNGSQAAFPGAFKAHILFGVMLAGRVLTGFDVGKPLPSRRTRREISSETNEKRSC